MKRFMIKVIIHVGFMLLEEIVKTSTAADRANCDSSRVEHCLRLRDSAQQRKRTRTVCETIGQFGSKTRDAN